LDNLSFEEVKQSIQSFIFGVNTPSRWGSQAPFTNITLDWTVPEDLKDKPAIVGGKEQAFSYGDCAAEMSLVNRAFIELMIEGDANGRVLPTRSPPTTSPRILIGIAKTLNSSLR
jgi:anaerobic ribonucleoside-triphosphate reductase